MQLTLDFQFFWLMSHALSLPNPPPLYALCDLSVNQLLVQGEVFFITTDCILNADTLAQALYVHVGVLYVLGPNLSHLPPSLARPTDCHYSFPLSLAGRAHPLQMWEATLKFVFIHLRARPGLSWTLLSPNHTHTRILTYACVCPASSSGEMTLNLESPVPLCLLCICPAPSTELGDCTACSGKAHNLHSYGDRCQMDHCWCPSVKADLLALDVWHMLVTGGYTPLLHVSCLWGSVSASAALWP